MSDMTIAMLGIFGAHSQGIMSMLSAAILSAPVSGLPLLPAGGLFYLAVLGILGVFIVAAIVYGLSGTINSTAARNWARVQIYEAMLSGFMLILFLVFATLFFISPSGPFGSVGLPPGGYGCGTASDLYQLATCDLAIFNANALGAFYSVFNVATFLGMTSGINVNFSPTRAAATNLDAGGGLALPSIFPVGAETMLGFTFSAIIVTVLLNQVQLVILAGSLMWIAFFLTLGLIARSFGFSRSFGGTMIAIGLGLGFVFPLAVSLTYGYIDTQLVQLGCTASGLGGCTVSLTASLISSFAGLITYQGFTGGAWVGQLAMLGAGLTFIPFLNFTLVETFILDFSKAIGEKIDFTFFFSI
jgi:hypothetical protein